MEHAPIAEAPPSFAVEFISTAKVRKNPQTAVTRFTDCFTIFADYYSGLTSADANDVEIFAGLSGADANGVEIFAEVSGAGANGVERGSGGSGAGLNGVEGADEDSEWVSTA